MRLKPVLALALALGAAKTRADSSTTISTTVYADFTYRQNHDEGKHASADKSNGTEFDLKRFYLTVDHSFDETWDVRFRSDVGNETNGKYDVFVKNAYVEAKLAPELYLRGGAADMPWIPFVESLYGFRFVENVLVDRTKFGNSADWGLHAGGKFADGLASYAVSVVNGRGYSDPTRTQVPTVAARVSVNPLKELTIGIDGEVGRLGQAVAGVETYHNATRYDAVIAWVGGPLRAGVTGFIAKDYAASIVTSNTAKEDTATGGSLWASYAIIEPVIVFGRADYLKPKKDTNSDLKDVYFNLGVDYKPVKPVDLALAYKWDQVKAGTLSTSNGTIGSSVAGAHGTYQEFGIWTQVAF